MKSNGGTITIMAIRGRLSSQIASDQNGDAKLNSAIDELINRNIIYISDPERKYSYRMR